MALKQDKYDMEVQNDDAIKHCPNILWFFPTNLQSPWWIIFTWKSYFEKYNHRKSINESECNGSWTTEHIKMTETKTKKGTSKPSSKKAFCE